MGGEMNPAPERDEATTAREPPTDSHVEPGYGDGDVDIPEIPGFDVGIRRRLPSRGGFVTLRRRVHFAAHRTLSIYSSYPLL